MSEYLAIDPGEHPGWAIMDEIGPNRALRLVACGINKAPRRAFKVCFYEKPRILPKGQKGAGRPEDIITLAVTCGKLVGPFEELGARLEWVEPTSWKGNIPKPVHHAAIRHELGKTHPTEVLVIDNCLRGVAARWCEDAMDAVGLAMYARKHGIFK